MMMSFFRILIAYSSSVPLRSASITLPNEPLPSTIRKLKSVARMTSFLVMLCGTSLSPIIGIFFVMEVFLIWLLSCTRSAPSSGTGTL
uniref:Putative secreted peptide n=1 Tax=Anopheles braziliensis TaxID=58242 RepID=A0A2M3ZPQ3_9DIPT